MSIFKWLWVLPWVVLTSTQNCTNMNPPAVGNCPTGHTYNVYEVDYSSLTILQTYNQSAALDMVYGNNQAYCQRNGIAPCR